MCAVVICNHSQLVYSSDESANEAEIDEGDEESVGFGTVICEECCDCPNGTEYRNDEKNEDVVWCQDWWIVAGVDVDEPG